MERVACIDIGTVTVRLAVADVEDARVLRLIKRSTICDLGEVQPSPLEKHRPN